MIPRTHTRGCSGACKPPVARRARSASVLRVLRPSAADATAAEWRNTFQQQLQDASVGSTLPSASERRSPSPPENTQRLFDHRYSSLLGRSDHRQPRQTDFAHRDHHDDVGVHDSDGEGAEPSLTTAHTPVARRRSSVGSRRSHSAHQEDARARAMAALMGPPPELPVLSSTINFSQDPLGGFSGHVPESP